MDPERESNTEGGKRRVTIDKILGLVAEKGLGYRRFEENPANVFWIRPGGSNYKGSTYEDYFSIKKLREELLSPKGRELMDNRAIELEMYPSCKAGQGASNELWEYNHCHPSQGELNESVYMACLLSFSKLFGIYNSDTMEVVDE